MLPPYSEKVAQDFLELDNDRVDAPQSRGPGPLLKEEVALFLLKRKTKLGALTSPRDHVSSYHMPADTGFRAAFKIELNLIIFWWTVMVQSAYL